MKILFLLLLFTSELTETVSYFESKWLVGQNEESNGKSVPGHLGTRIWGDKRKTQIKMPNCA